MLHPADPFTWRRVVRRCLLGASTKLVAACLADYASPDGADVRPGNERLVNVTELGERTVRRALDKLREVGLVERVLEGSKQGRRGLADEYRLTIPDDLAGRVEMLDPDERPVDNPRSPATVTAVPVPDPVDNPRTAVPVAQEHRPLTTRTPVTDDKNTGHRDRPPKQTPNHSPTRHTGTAEYGAEVEDTTTHPPPVENPKIIDSSREAFRDATAALQALPDLGGHWMRRARDALGDTAGYADLVIEAARLAKGTTAA